MYGLLLALLLCITTEIAQAYVSCGRASGFVTQCYGTGAYCCGLYGDECCWGNVYSFWWFWFIWFMVFVLIVSCSICICIRRRRRLAAQPQYMVIDSQATYGTVPQSNYQAYAGYQYNQVGAPFTRPTMPATAPSYQEKPPDYSEIAGGRS